MTLRKLTIPAALLFLLGMLACGRAADGDERYIRDLDDPHWQVRASAADELGRRGAKRAIERLGKALTDDSFEVRASAAMALGRLGATSQLDAIRRAIDKDGNRQVTVLALFALGDLAAGESGMPLQQDIERLRQKLEDDSRRVSRAAKRVLQQLLGPVDAAKYVRESALGLKEIGAHDDVAPPTWRYDRVLDRLALSPDGELTLTRSFSLRNLDRQPLAAMEVLLPPDFPVVDRIVDAEGSELYFACEWDDEHRVLWFDAKPIPQGEAAAFTLTARSRRPLFREGSDRIALRYAPAPFDAAIGALRIEIDLPAGSVLDTAPADLRLAHGDRGDVATLERSDLSKEAIDEVAVSAGFSASAAKGTTPPRRFTQGGDLALAAAVAAMALGIAAALAVRLRKRSERAVLVIALTAGAYLFLGTILIEDNLPYYAVARSAILDGDLDRVNEFLDYNQTQAYTPDHRGPLDPVFSSVARAPSIVAGHALTGALNAVTPSYAPNGFSFPYLFLTALGDFLAVLAGCLACFALVERRIGGRYALFAVLSIVAGTNLLLFTYQWTASSFQPSFFLFAVFLNLWDKSRDGRSRAGWLGSGLLLGILGTVRTLNLGFAVIPLVDWIFGAVRRRTEGARGLLSHTIDGALLAVGLAAGYAPQLLMHRVVDDTWLVDSYGVGTGRFTGLLENLWGLLFVRPLTTQGNGLLLSMPIFFLVIVGIVLLLRFDRRLAIPLVAALGLQLLAVGSYEIYWGYFEFGTPYLVPLSPLFCLALASLMRAAHTRWPRFGPAVLWGLVAVCTLRNGWCLLLQLGSDMISHWDKRMPSAQILHSILMLDRKLDGDLLRTSGELGGLLRETVGALRTFDAGRLLGTSFWIALLVAGAIAVYAVWTRIDRWAARVPRSTPVAATLAVWIATVGWMGALGARTNVDYRRTSERRTEERRELEVERIEPGRTFTLTLKLRNAVDRLTVITFLEDAADVPQGALVGTIEIDEAFTKTEFPLHAGVDTADYGIERPESRPGRGHTAPLDKVCFNWRVHDDSSRFYDARAYCRTFDVSKLGRSAELKITSALAHGTLDVLMVNLVEPKLPRDPARRRWLAERW